MHRQMLDRIISTSHSKKVALNNIEIAPTLHTSGVGFTIQTDAFNLAILGPGPLQKTPTKPYEGFDILIVPFTHPQEQEAITQFVAKTKPMLCICSYFGIKMTNKDLLEHVRHIQRESKVQVVGAKDGMHIDPRAYAKPVRQQRLKV